MTEEALRLCPDTLFVDYTQIAQKMEEVDKSNSYMAKCDATKGHPYPSHVAANIYPMVNHLLLLCQKKDEWHFLQLVTPKETTTRKKKM
eukprot:11221813-Ditylum_brightwellii.AAC.1